MYVRSYETKLEKIEKTLKTYREMKDEISSIKELVEITGYSKSSIQRYLQEAKKLDSVSIEEKEEIQNWLNQNKEKGLIAGGVTSQEKYGYSKDEAGHFKGGKKNG